MKILFLALSLLFWSPAWAVNKCTGPDGKLVFQDAPCVGKGETLTVRPASGAGRAYAGEKAAPTAPQDAAAEPTRRGTEAERIEALIEASKKERRLRDLQARLVPNADDAVTRQRASCDPDMKALQDKKALAKNNLAGATWEGSISTEMTALATTCDTRNREMRENAAAVRAECQQLGGCKR